LWVYDQTYFTWILGNENIGAYEDQYGTSAGVFVTSLEPLLTEFQFLIIKD
jgi:hypothetical protein